jgi:hypothetical protein
MLRLESYTFELMTIIDSLSSPRPGTAQGRLRSERFLSRRYRALSWCSPCYRVTRPPSRIRRSGHIENSITVQRCCQKEAISHIYFLDSIAAIQKGTLDSSDMLSPFGNIQFSLEDARFIIHSQSFFKHTHRGLLDRWTLLFVLPLFWCLTTARTTYIY